MEYDIDHATTSMISDAINLKLKEKGLDGDSGFELLRNEYLSVYEKNSDEYEQAWEEFTFNGLYLKVAAKHFV